LKTFQTNCQCFALKVHKKRKAGNMYTVWRTFETLKKPQKKIALDLLEPDSIFHNRAAKSALCNSVIKNLGCCAETLKILGEEVTNIPGEFWEIEGCTFSKHPCNQAGTSKMVASRTMGIQKPSAKFGKKKQVPGESTQTVICDKSLTSNQKDTVKRAYQLLMSDKFNGPTPLITQIDEIKTRRRLLETTFTYVLSSWVSESSSVSSVTLTLTDTKAFKDDLNADIDVAITVEAGGDSYVTEPSGDEEACASLEAGVIAGLPACSDATVFCYPVVDACECVISDTIEEGGACELASIDSISVEVDGQTFAPDLEAQKVEVQVAPGQAVVPADRAGESDSADSADNAIQYDIMQYNASYQIGTSLLAAIAVVLVYLV